MVFYWIDGRSKPVVCETKDDFTPWFQSTQDTLISTVGFKIWSDRSRLDWGSLNSRFYSGIK